MKTTLSLCKSIVYLSYLPLCLPFFSLPCSLPSFQASFLSLLACFLPSFLPSYLPSYLPFFLPFFLPSCTFPKILLWRVSLPWARWTSPDFKACFNSTLTFLLAILKVFLKTLPCFFTDFRFGWLIFEKERSASTDWSSILCSFWI